MKNPIYIEYYSHEKEDCYKIDLPWSDFGKETIVLCKVSEGYTKSKLLALEVIGKRLVEVTLVETKENKGTGAIDHEKMAFFAGCKAVGCMDESWMEKRWIENKGIIR